MKDWEDHTKKQRIGMLARAVFPKLGALPIRGITPAQILDVLQSAHTRGPSIRAEAQRTMSAIFDHALHKDEYELDTPNAIANCATVANWETDGGAPPIDPESPQTSKATQRAK